MIAYAYGVCLGVDTAPLQLLMHQMRGEEGPQEITGSGTVGALDHLDV